MLTRESTVAEKASAGSTRLSFAQSVNAAQRQAMELDPGVFVYGIGADGKAGICGTTTGLVERFGPQRVFDTPIAEGGLAALAAGAGRAGLGPGSAAHQEPAHLVRARAGPAGGDAGLAGRCQGPPALEHHERRSDAVHR